MERKTRFHYLDPLDQAELTSKHLELVASTSAIKTHPLLSEHYPGTLWEFIETHVLNTAINQPIGVIITGEPFSSKSYHANLLQASLARQLLLHNLLGRVGLLSWDDIKDLLRHKHDLTIINADDRHTSKGIELGNELLYQEGQEELKINRAAIIDTPCHDSLDRPPTAKPGLAKLAADGHWMHIHFVSGIEMTLNFPAVREQEDVYHAAVDAVIHHTVIPVSDDDLRRQKRGATRLIRQRNVDEAIKGLAAVEDPAIRHEILQLKTLLASPEYQPKQDQMLYAAYSHLEEKGFVPTEAEALIQFVKSLNQLAQEIDLLTISGQAVIRAIKAPHSFLGLVV